MIRNISLNEAFVGKNTACNAMVCVNGQRKKEVEFYKSVVLMERNGPEESLPLLAPREAP